MTPNWDRKGPQVKLPNTSTTGLAPRYWESRIKRLPSCVLRAKSGADCPIAGPSKKEPSSPLTNPFRRVRGEGPSLAVDEPAGRGGGDVGNASRRSSGVT